MMWGAPSGHAEKITGGADLGWDDLAPERRHSESGVEIVTPNWPYCCADEAMLVSDVLGRAMAR
jgi:hypothetical protein